VQSEEIQPCELGRYISELQAVVLAICDSPSFRASPKSCQFLRHIVDRTLQGNVDELKERLIGFALLGRDASYDTGSDAGVRVRANDVRKRLAAYYAANCNDSEFTVDIPAGSYVPRFYMPRSFQHVDPVPEFLASAEPALVEAVPEPPLAAKISLHLLACPTLVALFLCIICMRWQLAQEHPFASFWNSVFQDHHALLYVPISQPGEPQEVAPFDRLEDIGPLFSVAGQFHTGITPVRSLTPRLGPNDVMIIIGTITPSSSASSSSVSTSSPTIQEHAFHSEDNRLFIDTSPSGPQIVDRSAGYARINTDGPAALLTIVNGAERSIHIDGTDNAAIDALIMTLCNPNAFPEELAGSFQDGSVTQIVFPIAPHAQSLVFHEALPMTETALNGSSENSN
jgi:hypothetical protein